MTAILARHSVGPFGTEPLDFVTVVALIMLSLLAFLEAFRRNNEARGGIIVLWYEPEKKTALMQYLWRMGRVREGPSLIDVGHFDEDADVRDWDVEVAGVGPTSFAVEEWNGAAGIYFPENTPGSTINAFRDAVTAEGSLFHIRAASSG
jgi:hypothetical protein